MSSMMNRNDGSFCYGCASAAITRFPGYPSSGMRCTACIRNPGHTRMAIIRFKSVGLDFFTAPMDNYLNPTLIIEVEEIFSMMNNIRDDMWEAENYDGAWEGDEDGV